MTTNGREWGLIVSSGVGGNLEEDFSPRTADGMSFTNWENSALVRLNEFLGFSTVAFENEILGLLRKMHID